MAKGSGDGNGISDEFASLKKDIESVDSKREALIGQTREILKASKGAIYSLQRGDNKAAEKALAGGHLSADDPVSLGNTVVDVARILTDLVTGAEIAGDVPEVFKK